MSQQPIDPDDILNVGRISDFVKGVQGDTAARKHAAHEVHIAMVKGAGGHGLAGVR